MHGVATLSSQRKCEERIGQPYPEYQERGANGRVLEQYAHSATAATDLPLEAGRPKPAGARLSA